VETSPGVSPVTTPARAISIAAPGVAGNPPEASRWSSGVFGNPRAISDGSPGVFGNPPEVARGSSGVAGDPPAVSIASPGAAGNAREPSIVPSRAAGSLRELSIVSLGTAGNPRETSSASMENASGSLAFAPVIEKRMKNLHPTSCGHLIIWYRMFMAHGVPERKEGVMKKKAVVIEKIGVLMMALGFLQCQGDPATPELQVHTAQEAAEVPAPVVEDMPYRHPMLDGFTGQGVVLLDVLDDPMGRRYTVGEQAYTDDAGNRVVTSGIETVEYVALTDAEKEELVRTGQRGYARHYRSSPVLSETLEAEAQRAAPDATFTVHVNYDPPASYRPLIYRMEEALALGEVFTESDYAESRLAHLGVQQEEVRQASAPIVAFIEGVGGKVEDVCRNLFCLDATLTADQLAQLARFPGVARINELGHLRNNTLDGITIAQGTQMETAGTGDNNVQFTDNNVTAQYYGNKHYPGRIRVGVLEHTGFRDEHPGFKDSAGVSRIQLRRSCYKYNSGFPWYNWYQKCESITNFPDPSGGRYPSHGTSVAGIVAGDLTAGQDPNWPGTYTTNQRNRSGHARHAAIYLWNAQDDDLIDNALDDIVGYDPHVVNMSIDASGIDSQCEGEDSLSLDANDLYEAGIPLIMAAGNAYHDDADDCRVDSPGSAIGVFLVGGHSNGYTEYHVSNGDIWDFSSRGGSLSEGKGRTIVDLSAVGARMHLFNISDGYEATHHSGTSFAAPTVTAGAAVHMDFYTNTYSSAVENPGVLYTHLLLMGDRAEEGTPNNQPNSDFDSLYGAGRFKMRRLDEYGIDSPGWFASWTSCVGDGQTLYYYINGGAALSADTDVIKAVLFWYDYRHENGTAIDNLNLDLQECVPVGGGLCMWQTSFYRFVSPTEEKERVFLSGALGGRKFRLAVTGADVTSVDVAGCSGNAMRFHIAWMYEDSARDDAGVPGDGIGPSTEIDPEQ